MEGDSKETALSRHNRTEAHKRPAQVQARQNSNMEEGKRTQSPSPDQGTIYKAWLLEGEKSLFFRGVALGISIIFQGKHHSQEYFFNYKLNSIF